jgi:hypothetical protein
MTIPRLPLEEFIEEGKKRYKEQIAAYQAAYYQSHKELLNRCYVCGKHLLNQSRLKEHTELAHPGLAVK